MAAKIALVTGGSRGLGRDMALSLAKKGIDVILTYHTQKEEAEKVVAEITQANRKAVALPFDAGNIPSIDGFVSQLLSALKAEWNTDKFDYLVNNGGHGATIPILQVTETDFDRMVNVHFKGVFFLTQKCLPHINDNGGIVFVSSGSTRFSIPGYAVYASSKGSLEVLTKYVAKEFGSRGIRSNIIAPGATKTDFNNATIRNNPEREKMIASLTPLGRVGRADDIGSVVAFLCSDEAKWVNAQRIEISGGIN